MEKIWGWSLHLNLKECDAEKVRDMEGTKQFLVDLTKYIKMTQYLDPFVFHFGKDPAVSGISCFQLLEESNISGHFVEQNNSVYLDIFSCCSYNPQEAFDYCVDYFKSSGGTYNFLERGV